MLEIPEYVSFVCERLHRYGKQAYVVGGAVRDLLSDRIPNDYDIATDATPNEVEKFFEPWHDRLTDKFHARTLPTGKQYGTITVLLGTRSVEVTTFRTDGQYFDGRRPEVVKFGKSIEEDLARRDFTINAIAYDPLSDSIIDPFGGQYALHQENISTVGEPEDRFREDALRMMRAIRLSARFCYAIDPELAKAVTKMAPLIQRVSIERINDEFSKILTCGEGASWGVYMLWRTGLLNYISPLHSLQVDLDQPKPHTKDVFGHTLAVLHQVQQQKDLVLSLAALYHDIGKPFTRVFTETGLHYYDHEDVGERLVREELARLRFSNSVVDAVATLVKNHMMTLNCGKPALRRLYKRLDGEDLGWRLRDLMKADIQGCSMENWLEYQPAFEAFSMKMVGVWSDEFIVKPEKLKLAINGDMVMEICKIPPGPEVGRILKCLEEAVLDHPRYNNQQWLMNRAERLHVEAK